MSDLRTTSGSRRKPVVSVVTPTLPERAHLLEELEASVRAQTFLDWEHIVAVDVERAGCAVTVNRAAREATGDWLFLIADDDLMLPRCLEHHLSVEGVDVVYAPPLVWGEAADQFWSTPPTIPSTCLIRRAVWERFGGYNEALHETEDRDLYTRVLEVGLAFGRFGAEPTWMYRFWGGNKSRSHLG